MYLKVICDSEYITMYNSKHEFKLLDGFIKIFQGLILISCPEVAAVGSYIFKNYPNNLNLCLSFFYGMFSNKHESKLCSWWVKKNLILLAFEVLLITQIFFYFTIFKIFSPLCPRFLWPNLRRPLRQTQTAMWCPRPNEETSILVHLFREPAK